MIYLLQMLPLHFKVSLEDPLEALESRLVSLLTAVSSMPLRTEQSLSLRSLENQTGNLLKLHEKSNYINKSWIIIIIIIIRY
jgi:hypothetical protein